MQRKASLLILILLLAFNIGTFTACTPSNTPQDKAQEQVKWTEQADTKTQQFRTLFKKARQLQAEEKFKQAYATFSEIDKNYKTLYDFVLFNKAESAKNIPNEQAVLDNLNELIKNYPQSPILDQALYALGQAHVRLSNSEKAKETFLLLIEKFPETEYATGAHYYLGEIFSNKVKNEPLGTEHFRAYLDKAPNGRFGPYAANGLITLVGENYLTQQDQVRVGKAYFHAGEFNKAIKFLGSNFSKETWYELGKSYLLSGNLSKAITTFKMALSAFDDLDTDKVDEVVKTVARQKGISYETWKEIETLFPKQADIALYFQAQRLNFRAANHLYKRIVAEFPDSQYAPESSWFVIWDMFSKGNYDEAIKLGKIHLKKYTDAKSTPRVAFWGGKAYERKEDKLAAIEVYHKVVKHFPGDYYSYRAQQRLNELEHGQEDILWKTIAEGYEYNSDWSPNFPLNYDLVAKKYGAKIAELLYLEDLASVESVMRENMDPIIQSYFYLKDGNIPKSIVTIREKQREILTMPPGTSKVWELLYPLHYSQEILENALKYNVDPLLVQSITREESYFNSQAISSANARGLMQLMPGTAKGVAQWENIDNFDLITLFDPTTNIQLGTRYLRYTHEANSSNSMLAVASYNGGPGNVAKWLNMLPTSDWDQFVEEIPYDETREYVRKVFTSYWNYRAIYAKNL